MDALVAARRSRQPDRHPVPEPRRRRRALSRSSAASATGSTSRRDVFRDGHELLRAVVRYRAPGDEGVARGADAPDRRAHIGGVRWAARVRRRPGRALGVRRRGLDRPLRHLARRARAASSPPASTISRASCPRARCCCRRRPPSAARRRTGELIEHALRDADATRTSPSRPSTTSRSETSCCGAIEREQERHGSVVARASRCAHRGRPRARALRLLV